MGAGSRLKSVKVQPAPINVLRPITHICRQVFCATMLLSIKVVMKSDGAEGQEGAVSDHREHELAALGDIDIIADDAVLDHRTGVDGDVVADGGRPVDDGVRVDDAVAPHLHQLGTLQQLLAFVHGAPQDAQLEERVVFEPVFEMRAARRTDRRPRR